MSTQVYVVIRRYNHYSAFQPSLIQSPVVTWNAGSTHIEGVFTYYPSRYVNTMGYEIHGPYPLQGGIFNIRNIAKADPYGPQLNYPNFDFPSNSPFEREY